MQGIKNFTDDESKKYKGENPDISTQDLFENIEKGNYPKWRFCIQIMPEKDGWDYKWDIFDVTKVWNHSDYPLKEVGIMELNRNP